MSPGSRRASPQSAREVVELDRDEAMRLLASVDHGRVVFTRAALPAIRPVNHLVVDGRVIVRTRLTAHPARIRILELLVERDRSVGELLSSDVGLESSNLSQQLGVLRRAGVVAARRDGNAMIYSIAAPDIAELLAVARKVLARVLSDRVAVLEDLRAGGSAT